MCKISTDKHPSYRRRLPAGFEVHLHQLETGVKILFDLLVPVRKFAKNLRQQPDNFLFRQGHDSGEDAPANFVGGGTKRAE